MTERHFAFFRLGSGEWVREWKGPVPEPALDPMLLGDAREAALMAWATTVAPPEPGEIGLDVTQFDYPVGDFVWMRFDEIDRRLYWPVAHKFIQVDRATMVIDSNTESPRPVRSTPNRIVIDITGTPLESHYGQIFGQIVRRHDRWELEPVEDLPVETRRALEAAQADMTAVVGELARELARI